MVLFLPTETSAYYTAIRPDGVCPPADYCANAFKTEAYRTSSPAKSKTLVMVTLAGPDDFVSVTVETVLETVESSWRQKQKNDTRK